MIRKVMQKIICTYIQKQCLYVRDQDEYSIEINVSLEIAT